MWLGGEGPTQCNNIYSETNEYSSAQCGKQFAGVVPLTFLNQYCTVNCHLSSSMFLIC